MTPMTDCEHAQEQMLDALYGLLEPAAEDTLRLHIEQCASCRTLAAEAEEQRRLLSRAAQVCVRVAEFSVPSDAIVAGEPEPEILPLSSPMPQSAPAATGKRRRFRVIAAVAAAAALLLAAAGLWSHHLSEVGERETELADARSRLREFDDRIAQAQKDFQREQAKLPKLAERGLLRVEVAGPGTVTADAPTPIRVSTRDVAGNPAPAKLTIRQVANGKELHRQEVASKGDRTVTLPASPGVTGNAKLLVEARADDGIARIEETIKLEAPAHMAHLAVSKSLCQVGEVLFFRALVLRGFDMRLPEKPVPVQFTLLDASGKAVKRWSSASGPGGIVAGELPLTQDLISGVYTLEVKGAASTLAMLPARRQVEILRDLPPQLQFDRQEYRGGDELKATFKGRRLPNGAAIPNQDYNVRVTVDGKEVKVERTEQQFAAPAAPGGMGGGPANLLRTDAAGNAAFRAKLPANIEIGKALVEIQARASQSKKQEKHDKLVQSIPVVASRLTVDFFPEGGQLVAGVPNRVYYRVRTPLGEPADPEGFVIILSSKDVVLASERNQGLGAFTFTPDAGDAYTLRITSSKGIVETANPFAKLGIRAKGVALHVPEVVTSESQPLRIVVRNTGDSRRLLVVASCRGHIVAQDFVDAAAGSRELSLDPVAGTRGVVRVTVYDAGGATLLPLAERLVYRTPAEKLAIAAPLDKKSYRPGERANLQVSATTERGDKVQTWFLAGVVDERALGAFDRSAAGPAASFYLLSTVRQAQDLDHADLLLLDSEQARQDLDLFLGTQGWRRYVAAEPVEPTLMANRGNSDAGMTLFCRESASPAELQAKRIEAIQAAAARLRGEHIRDVTSLDEERSGASTRVNLLERELADLLGKPVEMLRLGMGILAIVLIVAGIVALSVGLIRGWRRSASSTSAFAGACGCLLACLILYAVSGSLPDQPRVDRPTAVAELPKNRLIPDAIPQPEGMTTAQRGVAQGVFALAPNRRGDGKSLAEAEFERRPTARMTSRDYFAKVARARELIAQASADKNQEGAASAPVSNLMKQRFAEFYGAGDGLHNIQPTYAATDPSTTAKSKASKGNFGGNEARRIAADVVREYRYQANGAKEDATKNDAAKDAVAPEVILLWHPALFAAEGRAGISFDLPRAPAAYRILILGHDANGRVGQLRERLESR